MGHALLITIFSLPRHIASLSDSRSHHGFPRNGPLSSHKSDVGAFNHSPVLCTRFTTNKPHTPGYCYKSHHLRGSITLRTTCAFESKRAIIGTPERAETTSSTLFSLQLRSVLRRLAFDCDWDSALHNIQRASRLQAQEWKREALSKIDGLRNQLLCLASTEPSNLCAFSNTTSRVECMFSARSSKFRGNASRVLYQCFLTEQARLFPSIAALSCHVVVGGLWECSSTSAHLTIAANRTFNVVNQSQNPILLPQLKRSPFLLLYGSAASYLLLSLIFWSSVSGECPTAATSSLASELGLPAWSSPFTFMTMVSGSWSLSFFDFFGFAYVWSEPVGVAYCSKRRRRACFWNSASWRAARSALMDFLAK